MLVDRDSLFREAPAQGVPVRLPDPYRSRILLVGASAYDDPALPDLPSVRNNLLDLEAIFTDPFLLGMPKSNITILDNPRVPNAGVEIERTARTVEDTLVLYYAGHGLPADGRRLYLATSNTVAEYPAHTSISLALIREAIAQSPARSKLLILDCCFSGRAIEAMSDARGMMAGESEIVGTYTMASAGMSATSVAPAGRRNTAFTEALLNVLSHGVPHFGETMPLGEIYKHVRMALVNSGYPAPEQRGTGLAHEFAIIRNASARNVNTPDAVLDRTRAKPDLVAITVADDAAWFEDRSELLRVLERETRARVRSFMEGLIRDIESRAPAALSAEHLPENISVRLRDFWSRQIKRADVIVAEQHPLPASVKAQEAQAFMGEYHRRLRVSFAEQLSREEHLRPDSFNALSSISDRTRQIEETLRLCRGTVENFETVKKTSKKHRR